jgi:hypothetical protein
MAVVSGYDQFGGAHPDSAALTNILKAAGIRRPDNGEPLSEALIFGIGGGPGAGYIMYEFKEHSTKTLVLGFHHLWQYPARFYQALCDRIGVAIIMPETGSLNAASKLLDDALDQDQAVVAWVDRSHMPYLQLPEAMKGHIGHRVAVCGRDDDEYWIDDRAAAPFRVPGDVLTAGRARISSYKSRLLIVQNSAPFGLAAAVEAGLRACAEHLSSDSDSFSLPTYRKWAKMMTDTKNKKGWPSLFFDRRGLFSTLRSAFEGVEMSVGEGALRGLYAHFLREAASISANPRLNAVADRYDHLAARWSAFAEAALPDEGFREVKTLLRQRFAIIMRGGDAWQTTEPLTADLRAMTTQYNLDFPLPDTAVTDLFTVLQEHLNGLYQGELAAHAELKAAI